MTYPFHLSFVVPDLRGAEAFYTGLLGCKKGRDTGQWIDIIFYGHQLTIHQAQNDLPAQSIDHFGVILGKDEWLTLIEKLKHASIDFVLAPSEKINDNGSESGKFVINDPANNALEFKFYQETPIDIANKC